VEQRAGLQPGRKGIAATGWGAAGAGDVEGGGAPRRAHGWLDRILAAIAGAA